MRNLICLGLCALALSACASSGAMTESELDFDDLMSGGRLKGAALQSALAAAEKQPLGSEKNPVRAEMPPGQRAYLNRLRCSDGNAPTYSRIGSFGAGAFGSIVDGYDVQCAGSSPAKSTIFMDMYFPGHVETRAVDGFTIVAP
jgi:hypothetical protein